MMLFIKLLSLLAIRLAVKVNGLTQADILNLFCLLRHPFVYLIIDEAR